jgi:hypothetical protein
MLVCPSCLHRLEGLPGAPGEAHGRFTAEARCPECGRTIPSGGHVLVGSANAASSIKQRPALSRAGAFFAHGGGCGISILHFFTLICLVFVAFDVVALLQGTRLGLTRANWGFIAFTLCLTAATAVYWWKRRRVDAERGIRADQVASTMIVAPDRIEFGGRVYGPGEIRSIRVVEQFRADGDEIVAAVELEVAGIARTKHAMFVPIPERGAEALARELAESYRGHAGSPPREIPARIEGGTPPASRGRGVFNVVVGATIGIGVNVLLVVFSEHFGWLFPVVLIGLVAFAAATFSTRRTVWRRHEAGIVVSGAGPLRIDRFGLPFGLIRRDSIAALKLGRRKGVPFLQIARKGFLRRDPTVVPDDWCGLAPAEFGRALAARIGVPFREIS